MRTLCYSVRLESLVRISDKAFDATDKEYSQTTEEIWTKNNNASVLAGA